MPVANLEAARVVKTLQCGKVSSGYSHKEEKEQVPPS